jgi:hypothetical protein
MRIPFLDGTKTITFIAKCTTSLNSEWFPADPCSGAVGIDDWLKAGVWFGPRSSRNPDASEMIVPIAILAADASGKFTIDRRHTIWSTILTACMAVISVAFRQWKPWTKSIDLFGDPVKGTFAGKVDLLNYESRIDNAAKTHDRLRTEFESTESVAKKQRLKTASRKP